MFGTKSTEFLVFLGIVAQRVGEIISEALKADPNALILEYNGELSCMKKTWLPLLSMVVIFGSIAATFSDGVQYVTLDKPLTDAPQILEFFSFYCKHCYQFDQIYRVTENMKKALPVDTKIARYHVEFLGPLGQSLTRSWAVAIALGIEYKISPLMFEAIQKTHDVSTPDDIRNVFLRAGVSPIDYDAALNSFVVKSLVVQQQKAVTDLRLHSVPAVFVSGKYMIKSEGLDTTSMDGYTRHLGRVVSFLIQKNNQE